MHQGQISNSQESVKTFLKTSLILNYDEQKIPYVANTGWEN